MEIDVIIKIPQGSRNKYEMDAGSGRIRLDRTLHLDPQAARGYAPQGRRAGASAGSKLSSSALARTWPR